MVWSHLAVQFCLEIGFGVLLALAFVHPAPVGRFFYRMMGAAALAPIAVAAFQSWTAGANGIAWCSSIALLGAPFVVGVARHRLWIGGVAWTLAWTLAALVASITGSGQLGAVRSAMACLSAVATGAVAGSVSVAMVLGHWYLTVPKLEIRHLERLNRVTVVSMVGSLAILVATCLGFGERLNEAETPLFGPWGLFYLGTRVTVGLLVPLAFAWMAAGALQFQNTRSATGILYASTILVLIGTAVSVSLQDSYGIPL